MVQIPVYALHRDPKYYENPETFNPDRFSAENLAGVNQKDRVYLPFGDGPRKCIALRLGKMQTKVGLVMMLQKFKFELGDHLKNKNRQFDPKAFMPAPLEKIQLKIFKR